MSIRLKSITEFKEYARAELFPQLQELEKRRIITLRNIIWYAIRCIIASIIIGILFSYFVKFKNSFDFYFFLTLLSCFPLWIVYCRNCIKLYRLGFKEKIIEKIVRFIDDKHYLDYAINIEDNNKTLSFFGLSQLFDRETNSPEFLKQTDYVSGNIEGTDIFFASIAAQKISTEKYYLFSRIENFYQQLPEDNLLIKKGLQILFLVILFFIIKTFFVLVLPIHFKQSESSAKQQLKIDIFKGLFFVAKFPHNFTRRIFILPHNFANKINIQTWRGKRINLEDSEFNKIFCVYGDSQLESRYILSTNLMKRLVEFQKKAKKNIYLSFIEGHVFIAIRYYHDLFQPKLMTSMLSFAPLKEYFETLQLMIGIVQDLNLNQKIWKS